jgi:hypothetical protein
LHVNRFQVAAVIRGITMEAAMTTSSARSFDAVHQVKNTVTRRTFVDELKIMHEPRGRLSRYFLKAERDLKQKGIAASFIGPDELYKINEDNLSSWAKLMPVLDGRINDIAADDLITIAAYDTNNTVVSTISVRRMDIVTSVKEEMESLRFFYSKSAVAKRLTDRFILTAPSAKGLRGNIFYLGGLWVRPDQRHNSLPVTMTRIIRYLALARWNPDYEIGIATNAFLRPNVAKIYAFQTTEAEFSFEIDGQLKWRGVFVCSDRAANLQNLDDDIELIEREASSNSRRDEQMVPGRVFVR